MKQTRQKKLIFTNSLICERKDIYHEKKLGRMIILVLALVTLFSFTTTANAYYNYMGGIMVKGGDSQVIWTSYRTEPNSMDVEPIWFNWLGQYGLKFRGYKHLTNTKTTELKSIYSEDQRYCADYITSNYYDMDIKMSINNSDPNIYMFLDARIWI